MELQRRYPVGIQDFEKMRDLNCIYVDKTDLIYKLASEGDAYFLSRPRRFGKSLLLSTMEAYFMGKKDLFKGLAIEKLETVWEEHPVLHISFSRGKYFDVKRLYEKIDIQLSYYEELYGLSSGERVASSRLEAIIRRAYERTGHRVVVLIDEYDSPLLDNNSNLDLQTILRDEMRDFFSPLKDCGKYLRFLFITGITKFSQLSIFSELNNLTNISMLPAYSAICGITEEELLTTLRPDVEALALSNDETYEESCLHLKKQYDGYHFSMKSPDIYNPFSLMSVLMTKQYDNFWFGTGTPTFLIELLQRTQADIITFDEVEVKSEYFDRPTMHIDNPIPVLYQSGYLTIKSYNPLFKKYTLSYPNEEVRIGFLESLLPNYAHVDGAASYTFIQRFIEDLWNGDINACMERTQSFFASIPNDLSNKSERDFQTVFYLFFRLMGQYVETEIKTATGRIDALLRTRGVLYLFEFKMNSTADAALAQIESKQYAIPYRSDGDRIVKIGVNFDTTLRTLGEWKIVEE